MDRRRFLTSTALAAGGLMLGNGFNLRVARAAGLDPDRKFVFLYFSGAWDLLLGLDPRRADEYPEDAVDETGIRLGIPLLEAANSGVDLSLVGDENSPYILGPAMRAMARHTDVASVVRGLSMDTVTHEVGRRYFLTGMVPRGLNAAGSSMGARVVAQQGDHSPIPNLICASEGYVEGLPNFASPLSVGSVADLVSALSDGLDAPAAGGALRAALDAHRARGAANCDPAALNRYGLMDRLGASAIKARDLVVGSGEGLSMAQLFNFRLADHQELRQRYGFQAWQLDGIEARVAMVSQALRYGVSQAITVTVANNLDTHDENWASDQLDRQRSGWDLVAALLDDLKSYDDPGVPGRKLIDTTTVVAFSEFGRTAKLNNRDGRDHSIVNACLLAGAGVPRGQLFGASTAVGMNPLPVDPISGQAQATGTTLNPNNILASVLAGAGMDTSTLRHDGLPFLQT